MKIVIESCFNGVYNFSMNLKDDSTISSGDYSMDRDYMLLDWELPNLFSDNERDSSFRVVEDDSPLYGDTSSP